MKRTRKAHAEGKHVHVRTEVSHLGVSGVYHVDAHGKAPEDVLAEVQAIEAHHQKKAARFRSLQGLWGMEFRAGAHRATISDATLKERGGDVELYLALRDADTGDLLPNMPVRSVHAVIDDTPDNAVILDMAQNLVDAWAASTQQQQRFLTQLNAIL